MMNHFSVVTVDFVVEQHRASGKLPCTTPESFRQPVGPPRAHHRLRHLLRPRPLLASPECLQLVEWLASAFLSLLYQVDPRFLTSLTQPSTQLWTKNSWQEMIELQGQSNRPLLHQWLSQAPPHPRHST